MEGIRDAFDKVKKDISSINEKLDFLNVNLSETRSKFVEMCNVISVMNNTNESLHERVSHLEKKDVVLDEKIDKLTNTLEKMNLIFDSFTSKMMSITPISDSKKEYENKYLDLETGKFVDLDTFLDKKSDNSTDIPSEKGVSDLKYTDIKTNEVDIKARKDEYSPISTGNRGVQTDKQTDKQTDNSTNNSSYNQGILGGGISLKRLQSTQIDDAVEILDSLDSIKKEIRLKFRRLTDQELTVFAAIYQLEDEFGYSDYKTIAKKLDLTESSIRDYVRRLINKGIPVEKSKINNKGIKLVISKNLKKIASLNTILELREL